MNKYHQEILDTIKKYSKTEKHTSETAKYLGHSHYHYGLSVPQRREIAKRFISNHKDINQNDFVALLDSLYRGESYDEKSFGGILLGYLPKLRKQINPTLLDIWLDYLEGWAEIDSLCQSNFTSEDILDKWKEWMRLIKKFSKSKNINRRRASLVLLTGVVTQSDDSKLSNLAFKVIDKFKHEKSILITKAVSWLLRDLIKHHKDEVEVYLNKNIKSLPQIIIREVNDKLVHGRK